MLEGVITTRTATVQRLGGVVVARISPEVIQELADAADNIGACARLAGDVRCPVVVDLQHARPLSAEVRHYYTGERLTQHFTALAILVDVSVLGQTMGNLYLRIARPKIPTRLFSDEAAALQWAGSYRL